MRVAEAAIAAFGEHEFFAELGEVMDQRFAILVENLGADRHLQHDRFAVGAMAVLAHAVGALRRLEVLLIAIVDQRVQPVDDLDDDVAATAAIAAGGAAELDDTSRGGTPRSRYRRRRSGYRPLPRQGIS